MQTGGSVYHVPAFITCLGYTDIKSNSFCGFRNLLQGLMVTSTRPNGMKVGMVRFHPRSLLYPPPPCPLTVTNRPCKKSNSIACIPRTCDILALMDKMTQPTNAEHHAFFTLVLPTLAVPPCFTLVVKKVWGCSPLASITSFITLLRAP